MACEPPQITQRRRNNEEREYLSVSLFLKYLTFWQVKLLINNIRFSWCEEKQHINKQCFLAVLNAYQLLMEEAKSLFCKHLKVEASTSGSSSALSF
jgi:hypothetical protein